MENLNIERKSLIELIKEAEDKKIQVVIIGAVEVGTMVERVLTSEHMMGIHIVNLKQEDQERILSLQEKRNAVFERPPIPIKAYNPEPLPKIFVSDEKKPWDISKKRKKLKGYQKGKKR